MTRTEKIRALDSITEELEEMAEAEVDEEIKAVAYNAKLHVERYAYEHEQIAKVEARIVDRLHAMTKERADD